MIDLHSHILPALDDGPGSDAAALEMARSAVAAGVEAIAATPHIDETYGLDPPRVARARDAFGALLSEHGVPLTVLQGGEVAMGRLLEMTRDELGAVTLGDGRHLLVECPHFPVGDAFDRAVRHARGQGFDVLLAHPERAPDFLGRPERLRALVAEGAAVQLTAGSVTGRFGRTVQRAALAMLEEGIVDVVASDGHDAHRRPPGMSEFVAFGTSGLDGFAAASAHWTDEAPRRLVRGEPLPPPPRVRWRRRLGLRLRAKPPQ